MLNKIKNFHKSPRSIDYNSVFKRAKIIECIPRKNYHVWVKFEDGLSGEVSLRHIANKGIFKEVWKTPHLFDQIKINPETNTLSWDLDGYEVDLDPYVLRENLR